MMRIVLFGLVSLWAAGCGAPQAVPYESCGTPGSRFYLEATVDSEPFSACVRRTSSWNLEHADPSTPGMAWHRWVDARAECVTGECLASDIGTGVLCSAMGIDFYNVELTSAGSGSLSSGGQMPSVGFFDPAVTMTIWVSRPDLLTGAGRPATCENGGVVATHLTGGRYSITQPGAPGEVVVVEVRDATVEAGDVPGHTLRVDYARWEFALAPLDVSP